MVECLSHLDGARRRHLRMRSARRSSRGTLPKKPTQVSSSRSSAGVFASAAELHSVGGSLGIATSDRCLRDCQVKAGRESRARSLNHPPAKRNCSVAADRDWPCAGGGGGWAGHERPSIFTAVYPLGRNSDCRLMWRAITERDSRRLSSGCCFSMPPPRSLILWA